MEAVGIVVSIFVRRRKERKKGLVKRRKNKKNTHNRVVLAR